MHCNLYNDNDPYFTNFNAPFSLLPTLFLISNLPFEYFQVFPNFKQYIVNQLLSFPSPIQNYHFSMQLNLRGTVHPKREEYPHVPKRRDNPSKC